MYYARVPYTNFLHRLYALRTKPAVSRPSRRSSFVLSFLSTDMGLAVHQRLGHWLLLRAVIQLFAIPPVAAGAIPPFVAQARLSVLVVGKKKLAS